jgi:hypothetical protein
LGDKVIDFRKTIEYREWGNDLGSGIGHREGMRNKEE